MSALWQGVQGVERWAVNSAPLARGFPSGSGDSPLSRRQSQVTKAGRGFQEERWRNVQPVFIWSLPARKPAMGGGARGGRQIGTAGALVRGQW